MSKFLDDNGLLYLWGKIKGLIPKKTSELTNDSGFITAQDVPDAVSPSTVAPKMDGTAALGTDGGFARGDHVHPHDTTKVDKVEGKGLSTEDFTTEEKPSWVALLRVPTNMCPRLPLRPKRVRCSSPAVSQTPAKPKPPPPKLSSRPMIWRRASKAPPLLWQGTALRMPIPKPR